MPQRIQKRLWCDKCQEWEIFENNIKDKTLFCDECETPYKVGVDIPKDKILEQRKRYRASKVKELNEVFGMFAKSGIGIGRGMFGDDFWREPGSNIRIIEDDAGQENINKQKKLDRDKKAYEAKIQYQKDLELKASFHKLGRNDLCLCNSGKKYKRCCWNKIYKI